jgi:outer membrane receptor protein involved in Fe transport
MRLVAALVTALLAASAPARAQTPAVPVKGRIMGSVVDAGGEPIASATVTLTGPITRVTTTTPDGRFAMAGLPAGSYEVRGSLTGFAPGTERVRVARDRTVEVTLVLWVHAVERTVVTAAKTGEIDVQQTPAAISVLKGGSVGRLQSRNVQDLSGRAPGVTVSQNTGFAQLTIRGIGSTAVFAGTDPSSAVYVDGVYLARPLAVLGDFLDLDRVEVLRGPQGTLYGRNAVGGAINIFTRGPTNDTEASARVAVGSFDAMRAEARASGPIVRDRLLASAAFSRAYRDGFVRDLAHPDHPLGGEDSTAARGKVHVALDRRIDLLVSGDVFHQEPAPLVYAKVLAVKPGFQVANPPDLHVVRTSTLAASDYLHYGGAAQLNVRLPHQITLTSLTAYRRLENELTVDADITELDLTISNVNEYQHQLSQELTLVQHLPRLTWVGGLFTFDVRAAALGRPSQHPQSARRGLGARGLCQRHVRRDAGAVGNRGPALLARDQDHRELGRPDHACRTVDAGAGL